MLSYEIRWTSPVFSRDRVAPDITHCWSSERNIIMKGWFNKMFFPIPTNKHNNNNKTKQNILITLLHSDHVLFAFYCNIFVESGWIFSKFLPASCEKIAYSFSHCRSYRNEKYFFLKSKIFTRHYQTSQQLLWERCYE